MQVPVKNLDTGEQMDLAEAEAKLLKAINPLSLHIMRLTSEFVKYLMLFNLVQTFFYSFMTIGFISFHI